MLMNLNVFNNKLDFGQTFNNSKIFLSQNA
jgi:hypothetical protein